MTLATMLPWISRYHAGDRTGATALFKECPDMLDWTRAELKRLASPIHRGLPKQEDFVSIVHRNALQRMVDEHDAQQKVLE